MRISDWSSDVCSSDLGFRYGGVEPDGAKAINLRQCLARRHRHPGTHAERFDDTVGWSRHRDAIVRPSAAFNRGEGARWKDRKSVVSGTRVSIRDDMGGRRLTKKQQ